MSRPPMNLMSPMIPESYRSYFSILRAFSLKLFMWRSGNDLLATKKNLFVRKISDDSKCPICLQEDESVMHVLWHCPAASDVWAGFLKMVHKWKREDEVDLLSLWGRLSQKLCNTEMEEIATIMRSLWIRRNVFIFEKKFTSPSCVIRSAKDALNEFHQAQVLLEGQEGNRSATRGEKIWFPPEQKMVKANWDAALDVKARKMGAGVIIRNERGDVMATCHDQKQNVFEPALAECYALRKAMDFCRDLNFDKVTFEGDAQVVINTVNDPVEDLSLNGSIIEEMKMMLKGWQGWKVQYSHRDTNSVAHKLAKAALNSEEEKVWIEEAPVFVLNSLHFNKHCIDQQFI